ncbi:MAG: protein kinase [Deltaproteobacteria bacterium]|nr:protein kinase [Deltaproteobacteria bacterium]
MAESSGELLGGRFRLLGERASFPFGSWWEAEDDQGARTLVLRMHAEVADPAAKATQAMAQSASIDSPHVVAWSDGGTDAKGHGWLAAPMFGPVSLHEHVSRGEGIPPAEAAPILHQIARGMAHAESVGVQHLCIASELVRLVPLTEGGHGVKIYGYGLSDLLPSYKPLRKQESFLGVPDYMSPELCAGKAAEGASADIYAVGVLMYEAVRGRPPFAPTFASASASTTLKRHIFEKPLPLSVRYANAPHIKSFENICFKALAKTANRRQLTLAELEKELELLVVDEMRQQVVNAGAMSARGPTTARRLRTQVLPQIAVDDVSVAAQPEPSVVIAPEPAAEAAEPVEAAPVAAAAAAAPEPGPVSVPKRSESTLVFAGLGPAVRELAAAAARKSEDEEEDDEGESEAAAEPARAGAQDNGRRGTKGKKKRSQAAMPAAQVAFASAPTGGAPRPSETPTGEKVGTAAGAAAADVAARVRRKDEQTVKNLNEQATVTVAAASPPPEPAKPVVVKKGVDEQEDWFAAGVGEGPKKKNTAWIFIAVAAAIVIVVVIILVTGGKSTKTGAVQPPEPPTRYAYTQAVPATGATVAPAPEAKPAEPVPAPEAKPAEPVEVVPPPETKPVEVVPPPETKPAEVVPPPETRPIEVKPAEATKPIEVKPAEATKPIEVKPAEVKPAEATKPAETKPATATKPAETKPAETKPATVETKPAETKPTTVTAPVETKPAETKPVEVTTPATTPEDNFREQAKHYMSLGLKAYKAENYKLAAGYFQKAKDADSTNALAAKYLQMAREKMSQ